MLLPGDNLITIQVQLAALTTCTGPEFNNLWAHLYPESLLHLPLTPAVGAVSGLSDLSAYPQPFISDPNLANLTFIVADNDPVALSAAGAIAFDLGRRMNGSCSN